MDAAIEVGGPDGGGGIEVGVGAGQKRCHERREGEAAHARRHQMADHGGHGIVPFGDDAFGKNDDGGQARKGDHQRDEGFQESAEEHAALGVPFRARAKHALYHALMPAEIGGRHDQSEPEHDSGPGIRGIGVVIGLQHREMPFALDGDHLFLQGAPPADLPHRQREQRQPADEHDHELDYVGHDDGRETAGEGVDEHGHNRDGHTDPDRPAENARHEVAGGLKDDAQHRHHKHTPDRGVDDLDRHVVAAAEKLRDRVDAGAPVIGHENERGNDHGGHRAYPVEVRGGDAIRIGGAPHEHEVAGADVAHHDGHADGPEGQGPARQKEILGRLDVFPVIGADPDDAQDIGEDDDNVKDRQSPELGSRCHKRSLPLRVSGPSAVPPWAGAVPADHLPEGMITTDPTRQVCQRVPNRSSDHNRRGPRADPDDAPSRTR